MKSIARKIVIHLLCAVIVATTVLTLAPINTYAASVKVKLVYGDAKLKDENAYVVTILAEGFTQKEQDKFVEEAKKLANTFINCSPWDELQSVVKIYAVGTVSKQSGCKGDKAGSYKEMQKDSRDTYFGSYYWCSEIERLLVIDNYTAANQAIEKYKPETDAAVVLVNSEKYGGSGGFISVGSIHYLSSEIILHELGHTIAGLADEYYYREREAPNLTAESSKKKVKWKKFIGKNGVSVYPYEGSTSYYVPSENCKMKTLNTEFCEVCKEEIRKAVCENTNKTVLYYQPYANDNNAYDGTLDFCKYLILRKGTKMITGDQVEDALTITYYDQNGNKLQSAPKSAGSYHAKIKFAGAEGFQKCQQTIEFKIDHSYKVKKATSKQYSATCTDCGKKINKKVATPKIDKLTAKESGFSVTPDISESFADGIEIQYSTDKKFGKSVKTKTVKNHSDNAVSIEKLKKKTTYYVRVRAYHKSGKTKVYSSWSSVKSVKTK